MIPRIGWDVPTSAGKVIYLPGINGAAGHYNNKEPIAPDVTNEPPETLPQGRPPKAQVGTDKPQNSRPHMSCPPKADKATHDGILPSVLDKVSRSMVSNTHTLCN